MPNIQLLLQLAPSPMLGAIVDSNTRREYECESSSEPAKPTTLGQRSDEAKVLADR
jgi:hypothetical protein